MRCTPSKHWTTWTSLLVVGSLQIYILYCSITRYINLKYEVFRANNEEHKWILPLLNYQLLSIIISLGIVPLWIYSVIFSSTSFFCGTENFMNLKGFYQLVWDEAVRLLDRHIHNDFSIQRPWMHCDGYVKIAIFFPISNLLHVLMAYFLILPLPFIEAWLFSTNNERSEGVYYNNLEFLGSSSLIVKVKCTIEYLNVIFSLLNLSFQFSKFLWSCNKKFSLFLNFIQILVTVHILVNFSLFSIFLKLYFKRSLESKYLFLSPCMIFFITSSSDAALLFTSFSYFQFGFEKCVQCLLKSSWFNSINRTDNIPLSNPYDTNNCQSTTSSSAFYYSRNVSSIKNSLCPTISAALLFIFGMGLKTLVCVKYWEYLRESRFFMVYMILSLILVVANFMICFGMCLKPDWAFKLTEKELSQYSIITYPEKIESNYYRSLRSHQENSQISLSMTSNTNGSTYSKQKDIATCPDFINYRQFLYPSSSLNLPNTRKTTLDSTEYLQLNNHINNKNTYKPIHTTNSLTGIHSPTTNNYLYKDFKRTMLSNYKSTTPTYSILRPHESVRSDESDLMARKFDTNHAIKEEINNETDVSSDEDVFMDSTQSAKYNEQMKNNFQLKFVTFQLDKNPEVSPEFGSSNDNLTIMSLPTSDAFLKELDSGAAKDINYMTFKENSLNSLYVLESSGLTKTLELNL